MSTLSGHTSKLFIMLTFACLAMLTSCSNENQINSNTQDSNASEPRNANTADGKIQLPVEVIGPDGYTESFTFQIADAAGIDKLYVQCHRCGWRDATVQSGTDRGAKASVRLNGGEWINMDNATATVFEPGKSYGGIGGGFHTVGFTVPINNAVSGSNSIEFRFNKTDGFTSGYRVLSFNLRNSNGTNYIDSSAFADDDPTQWTPQGSAEDIAEGQALWNGKVALKESSLSSTQLKAACASCHAQDGRDLKYFNYSDWSIQERSKFHGLSEQQGKQIAAYIRSLTAPAPSQARPWNPPYQPGPGLDSKPIEQWAAGAGINAVLSSDKDMLGYLFPAGTSDTEIANVANIKGQLNVRELPVAIQLPDWNAWLPDVHPVDIWGDAFTNSDATKTYTEVRDALASRAAGMVQDKSVIGSIESVLSQAWKTTFTYMGGAVPCPSYDTAKKEGKVTESFLMNQLPQGKTCEDGLQAVNHWLAVKNWELFHTYGLEDDTATLYPYGEKRGWFGAQRNVFEVASHRSADNSQNFRHQSSALGSYHSSAWYHLQMVLNAGNRDPRTWFPQDWFYTPMFITMNSRDNRQPLATLLTAMQIKMYQNLDRRGTDGNGTDTKGANYDGWWLPFVTPWRFESAMGWEGSGSWQGSISADGKTSKGFPWTQLDTYEPGLRVKVTNALLRQFLDKQKSYATSSPVRRSATVTDSAYFEAADYVVPTDIPSAESSCFYSCPGGSGQAMYIYRALVRFKEMGVDAGLRGELIDYMKTLFPSGQNNWDALR
jgi:cytochrome c553